MQVTIDDAGRLVIPKPLRDEVAEPERPLPAIDAETVRQVLDRSRG
jgi:DNA-binding transcriptional regulator/RsmH inhibitor MraZ